ncbi:putative U box domain, Zinc finger, RING/FYVE/PHD-type [Helianthus annuus]|nr:putative U box domain, Zinc finger, RING/FYVE/PHD-type [Helianthus annuus]
MYKSSSIIIHNYFTKSTKLASIYSNQNSHKNPNIIVFSTMGDSETKGIEIPSYFVCPISLEIMKDPVTLSTGITYDRESIEKWLCTKNHDTCPITRQALTDIELIPNHTLRRSIQSWCAINAPFGMERLPTPRLPVSKPHILKLLQDSLSPHLQMKSLKRLKEIVTESDMNKRSVEAVGAADYLAYIVNMSLSSPVGDEAVSILYHLRLSGTGLKALFGKNGEFAETLTCVMQRAASHEPQAFAVLLLKSMIEVAEPIQVISLKLQFFIQLTHFLVKQISKSGNPVHEAPICRSNLDLTCASLSSISPKGCFQNANKISKKATKAALKLLIEVCPIGRTRTKAVEAGVVPVLIDILLDCNDKRISELVLTVLDQLCLCADGRAELLKHGAGQGRNQRGVKRVRLAVVSKKIFRVSPAGSERAVRILYSVAKFSGNSSVVQEMLKLGIVGNLCFLVQVECGSKSSEKAKEILKMHARVWKNSSCIPQNLVSSYPS